MLSLFRNVFGNFLNTCAKQLSLKLTLKPQKSSNTYKCHIYPIKYQLHYLNFIYVSNRAISFALNHCRELFSKVLKSVADEILSFGQ